MDKFDRELQRYILSCCVEAYPAHTKWDSFSSKLMNIDGIQLSANIIYLMEHELLTIRNKQSDDPFSFLEHMRATKKGIDFLQNDGGLSAILNVKTVKLHRKTVVILEDLIALSNLSEPEKERAKSTLGELSMEVLKTVVQAATTAGINAITK